jgi:hypothetical protein
MKAVEFSVRLDHSGYKTSAVQGKTGACTYSDKLAAERLVEKLYPNQKYTLVSVPCTQVGTLYSKWRAAGEDA